MRIVNAAPARRSWGRDRTAGERRLAHLESLGLVATSLAVAFGMWLAYQQHGAVFEVARKGLALGTIVNANEATNARDLAPLLAPFETAAERRVAVGAIAQSKSERGPLTHVGALASIKVSGATPLFTSADIAAIKPWVIVRSEAEYVSRIKSTILMLFAVFWIAHLVRRALGATGDPILLPAVQLLTGLGIIAMMSLRDPLRDTDAATAVAQGVVFGCAGLVALAFVDFENPRFRMSTLVPLTMAAMLSGVLLVFGSGPGTSDAKVNLLGVQPIELIRILAVLTLASFFSRRWELLREISAPIGLSPEIRRRVKLPRLRDVQQLAIIVGSLLVFFVLQKDFGPALVLGTLALAMYGVARGRVGFVVSGFIMLVAGFAIGHWLGIPSTVARRVAIWVDPWRNALVGGDQIAHAQWALASGGGPGVGVGFGEGQLIPAGHTDLIVAVLGEELGFLGLVVIAVIYALINWRILRIAARAPGDYTAFLALGCALSLSVPLLVIVGGLLGLMPLSGVVTPFLSYGKSSMICNIAAIAIPLAIARRAGQVRPAFARQIRATSIALFVVMLILVGRVGWLQVVRADEIALRPSLVRQADGGARYQYNPRLLLAARLIPRGTIFDRNGLALATSEPSQADAMLRRLGALHAGPGPGGGGPGGGNGTGTGGSTDGASGSGGTNPNPCPAPPARCYPLGNYAFHVIGDAARQTNWAARNTSFIERDAAPLLQGFDDHQQTVQLRLKDGSVISVVEHDYQELLPLVRNEGNLNHPDVRRVLDRERDVHVTLDGPFQALVARALEARARAMGAGRGAVVVVDVATGAALASASYPWPDIAQGGQLAEPAPYAPDQLREQLLDRARYGLYPPGSTFKLITAAAALNSTPLAQLPSYECMRLPDGRVGARVPGVGRLIRDDALDHNPHGHVDLRKGIVISCNAYFARLAMFIGPAAIADAASKANIQCASPPVLKNLKRTLPFAGYGQGEVLASPLRLSLAVSAIAGDGSIRDVPMVRPAQPVEAEEAPAAQAHAVHWLSESSASILRGAMRDVVLVGTGRALAKHPVSIAGKTGTAELDHAASHSWFVGFAPSSPGAHRIAFAVIVENAGYGGRAATSLTGDIVTAAKAAGVIQ